MLEQFYPVPKGKIMRAVPYMPYLNFSPSAWVLPLKFDGGGYRAGGKAMFDSQGNLWVGSNFTIGWQAQDTLWQGNFAKFDPNGRPLSPITTGFSGGGFAGGTFGNAVDADDNVWLTSYGGMAISKFDKNGKSLAGPDGITFNRPTRTDAGRDRRTEQRCLGPGLVKGPAHPLPQGRSDQGTDHLRGQDGRTLQVVRRAVSSRHRSAGPNLGDQRLRRARDALSGIRSDQGREIQDAAAAAAASRSTARAMSGSPTASAVRRAAPFDIVEDILVLKSGGNADESLTRQMWHKYGGPDGGSVTLLRPDGTQYPGSPFTGGGLSGPWAAVVDGNDNVWISNFAMPNSPITQLCGARVENCPPGFKTGDPIAPPGGYVGGGLQMQTDIAVGPAGDVWAMNNWQDLDSCFGNPDEALSTRCGGQGVTIFFGMAKPVRAPQIGPARGY